MDSGKIEEDLTNRPRVGLQTRGDQTMEELGWGTRACFHFPQHPWDSTLAVVDPQAGGMRAQYPHGGSTSWNLED